AYVGEVVLLPIFDGCRATNINNAPGCTLVTNVQGNERDYHIYAFAAFRLEGFNFGGQYKAPATPPCGGSDRCVRGAFVAYVSLEDAWDYGGAPDLGSSIVTLID
ncbi:hypothetical protein, partial [Shewanella frigidimarina]|uniref:hypothetical protein n=1 Tax=Shewanella frigidimarina TaxID=56812 RepID=UPI00191018D6